MSTGFALRLHKVRGYYLTREINEPLRPGELALLDYSIVCPLERPEALALPASWIPFPSVGGEPLYVSPSADERAVPSRFVQPIICRKRGVSEDGAGYVGLDSRILRAERPVLEEEALSRASRSAPPRPCPEAVRPEYPLEAALAAIGWPGPASQCDGSEVRLAIIDTGFGGWGALGRSVDEAALELARPTGPLQFPRSARPPERWQMPARHGVRMARVVQAMAPGVRLGLFETPFDQESHAYPTDLAAAIARAAGDWRADVILVAQADGLWGTPAHLRHVLRAAARHGRGGRGAAIVCSVGRLDANRDTHDSAALAGDDVNAQPWVIPVAACSIEGPWYRVFGYPVSRLGPSVELCAPGDIVRLPGTGGVADDASLAAALVAGTLVRVIERNPSLTLTELRRVLRLTALPGPVEEAPSTPLTHAEGLDAWDRSGHNFKLGYGRVQAQAAWLAAGDPVCHALLEARNPDPPDGAPSLELRIALAWEERVQALASKSPLAREYLALRGALVPLMGREGDLRDALLWLARHLLALRRTRAPGWPRDGMDHGVLVDRSLHLVDVLSCALAHPRQGDATGRILRWAQGLARLLEGIHPDRLAEFFAAVFGITAG